MRILKSAYRFLGIANILKNIRYSIILNGLKRKSFRSENALFIFSDPRGGSTWLMELLEQTPGAASIFEPFHPNLGSLDPNLNLGSVQ